MKVLFLWDSDYPWDVRVEKICNTLINAGCDVHLVCRNKTRKKNEEKYKNINIHRIPCLSKTYGTLNDIFTFPLFFSPIWLFLINKVVKSKNIDIIIVRDLPMSLAAITVAKIKKIPVVLDMAECYPELIRLVWKFEPLKFRNVFIRNPFIVDIIERISLKYSDHIFVMVEESRERLLRKGVCNSKISIVSNTPDTKYIEEVNATFPGSLHNKGNILTLLYVGFVNYSRGLDTVIKSLHKYIEYNKDVYLLILGNGNAVNYLKNMVIDLKLDSYVGFEGWIDNKKVPEYIASSDICLVPHHKCSHWDNTIPNKLFDYMAASKPVLVTNVLPMKRIIDDTHCGMVYNDYDTESFVTQLIKLQEKELRDKLGRNGKRAVQDHYNWGMDSKNMINTLFELNKI